MKERNTEQFFELICSGLWGGQADSGLFADGVDWETLCRMAAMQTVSCIFADGADTLPKGQMPPPELARRLFSITEATRKAHRLLDSVLAEIESRLREEGIEGILLKGQGLALNYLIPEHRMCGDIDLYPGKGPAYLKACGIVSSLGESGGRENESEKHFHFNRRGCSIEIHSHVMLGVNPFVNRRLQRWTDEMLGDPSKLRHVEINGVEVNLPPEDFDAVFILQHIANHLLKGGIGLRQICDWCRYLHVHGRKIDRDMLHCNLGRLRLLNCWKLIGWIAVNKLGLPKEEMPFYTPDCGRRAEKCVELILRKGNFGFYGKPARKSGKPFILRKMQSCLIVLRQQSELLPIMPGEVLCYVPSYLADGLRRLFTGK